MRANTEPSVWPKGCYHSSREGIIFSSSDQTWLTFTIKVKFKRLTSNGIESMKKGDTTPDCPQIRTIEIFRTF